MTVKIHCLNNISSKGTDALPAGYELTDDIDVAAGILVRSAAMHDMAFSPELLAIGRAGAGVNNIPLDRCADEGIVVFNTPGANANAVKELVLCALFLGARDVAGGIAWCRDNAADPEIGKAAEKAKKAFAGGEVMGKTLGVIGLGAIGKLVAKAASDLGMSVIGYDPFVTPEAAAQILPGMTFTSELGPLFEGSDYITIHVPAMDSTKGMIDEAAIAQMKDGVVFLNFSRDTLVDSDAMAAGLASGKVGRYITDFATPAVMAMERAVVLPHLGASTAEAEENCAVMAAGELAAYIDRGAIRNSVNFPAMELEAPAAFRICVLHENRPNMIEQVTDKISAAGANIASMANASRGSRAYTVVDTDAPAPQAAEAIAAIEGVYRVRTIA